MARRRLGGALGLQCGRRAEGSRVQARERGIPAQELGDVLGRCAHLAQVDARLEALRPQAVGATVPREPAVQRDVEDRGGIGVNRGEAGRARVRRSSRARERDTSRTRWCPSPRAPRRRRAAGETRRRERHEHDDGEREAARHSSRTSLARRVPRPPRSTSNRSCQTPGIVRNTTTMPPDSTRPSGVKPRGGSHPSATAAARSPATRTSAAFSVVCRTASRRSSRRCAPRRRPEDRTATRARKPRSRARSASAPARTCPCRP